MLTTSTIDILSDLNATLQWESTGSLGTMYIDEISTFYVKGILTTSSFNLRYQLKNGNLPTGLILHPDGTIQGKATTLNPDTHTFTISAVDSTGYEFLPQEQFEIKTILSTSTNFAGVYFKTYLNLEKRKEYKNFITDKQIFLPNLIYRPQDPDFGVQLEMRMFLHFGIEALDVSSYRNEMTNNFSKRRLKLGELKTAVAIENNKKLYEIIYLEVIDDLVTNNNTSTSFVFNNATYYPASINNMRHRLKNSNVIRTTEIINPKFTKNIQPNTLKILNYIPFVPICYCLPEKSIVLIKKIKDSGFKFNKINFDVDRLILYRSSQYVQNKYLLFNNQN